MLTKYLDQIFTVNISFIDTFSRVNQIKNPCDEIPLAKGGNHIMVAKSPFQSIRGGGRFETTVDLKQVKIPANDLMSGKRFGNNLMPKIPAMLTASSKTKFAMSVAMQALWCELVDRFDEYSRPDVAMRNTIIHFEVFDGNDALVLAPLDLIHPSSLNFESGDYAFINERYNKPYIFTDEIGDFLLLKRETDYATRESFILTGLDLYTVRLNKKRGGIYPHKLMETLRSIYDGLPTNEVFFKEQFISYNWTNNLVPFVNINNNQQY